MASLLGDLLPRPPKRWATALGLIAAYYGAKNFVLPHFFARSVKGEVAVVTGAGSGIGRLMALRLAKEGAQVALLDMNMEGCEAVAEECRAMGATARAYKCNVADRQGLYAVGKQVEEDFGRVDIVIANAGIVRKAFLNEANDDDMELVFKVNALGVMFTIKAFLNGMLQRNHGRIMVIASSAGRVGTAEMVSYGGSKWAAIGIAESLRLELRLLKKNISVTHVCPMYINTGMFEGARLNPRLKVLDPIVNAAFPVLEPDYVSNLAIDAMKQGQEEVVTPYLAHSTTLLKAILPMCVNDWALDVLGVTRSMSLFKQTR